ncbi:MAG: hypothetical protein ABI361_12755 [Nitrososphaera sp.]|jgi:replicative DNA helicase Mcm
MTAVATISESCKCSHDKTEHEDHFDGKRGRCRIQNCSCYRYVSRNFLAALETPTLIISQALRKQSGRHTVQGVIVSRSDIYNLISKTMIRCNNCDKVDEILYKVPLASFDEREYRKCPSCKDTEVSASHEYLTAVNVWMQDTQPKNELERLPVVLFGSDNESVGVGELVTVTGDIHIVKGGGRNSRLAPIMHAAGIKYEHREELELTCKDIAAVKKFAAIRCADTWSLIDRLTSMVALSVVGHFVPKKGLLLSAVNTADRDSRINILCAGDPGEAKSLLLRDGVKLIPSSKYVTSQYASPKSMTAIVDKEGDMFVLKFGPVVMAKQAFCAVNEIGLIAFEDQSFLFDIMAEGCFNVNKHGFDKPIDAPTTIIASTNQIGATWENKDRISDSELPLVKPLRDRFDLLFEFRRDSSSEGNRKYAYERSDRERKRNRYNYNFIKKYIHYAKSINPVLTDEAQAMLNEHWVQIATDQDFTSKRILDSLFKCTKAFARLRLSIVADETDANAAIEFYNSVIRQYGRSIYTPEDPRVFAIKEIQKVVLSMLAPIEFREATKIAMEKPGNEQMRAYLGKKMRVEDNKKLRGIRDIMEQAPGNDIVVTSIKPLVLCRSDKADRSDMKEHSPNSENVKGQIDQQTSCSIDLTDSTDPPDRDSDRRLRVD